MNSKTNILIRSVSQSDIDIVIELLQQISEFKLPKSHFLSVWNSFSKQNNIHSLIAVIDNQIVGYGSIMIETKIRGGKVGHVEDIVSHPLFQKKGIGKAVMDALLDIAKANGCYKIVLQCKEHNEEFYKKCGYEQEGLAMQMFIK